MLMNFLITIETAAILSIPTAAFFYWIKEKRG